MLPYSIPNVFTRALQRLLSISVNLFRGGGTAVETASLNEALGRAAALRKMGYRFKFLFLERFHDAPPIHICVGRNDEHKSTLHASGIDYSKPSLALKRALSETLERALWGHAQAYWLDESDNITLSELPYDYTKIAGFSQEQRKELDIRLSPNTRILALKGHSITNHAKAYIPTQCVSDVHYRNISRSRSEPPIRLSNTNGIATGTTREEAVYRAVAELIERDAFMIAYTASVVPQRIRIASIPESTVRSRINALHLYNFDVELVQLRTDFPLYVFCAALKDKSGKGPALTLGARASANPYDAAEGALREAEGQWYTLRHQDGWHRPLTTPRSMEERLNYWASPLHSREFEWFFAGEHVSFPLDTLPGGILKKLAAHCEGAGVQIYYCPMTTPQTEGAGLCSVATFSPQLQPLSLTDTPYLGGERLSQFRKEYGDDSMPLRTFPHPFP